LFTIIFSTNKEKRTLKDIILSKYKKILTEIDNLVSNEKSVNQSIQEEDDNADDFFASLQNNQSDNKSNTNNNTNNPTQFTSKLEIDQKTIKIYLITLILNDSYETAMKLCLRTHDYMIAVMFGYLLDKESNNAKVKSDSPIQFVLESY